MKYSVFRALLGSRGAQSGPYWRNALRRSFGSPAFPHFLQSCCSSFRTHSAMRTPGMTNLRRFSDTLQPLLNRRVRPSGKSWPSALLEPSSNTQAQFVSAIHVCCNHIKSIQAISLAPSRILHTPNRTLCISVGFRIWAAPKLCLAIPHSYASIAS